jgi:hypothetical protein
MGGLSPREGAQMNDYSEQMKQYHDAYREKKHEAYRKKKHEQYKPASTIKEDATKEHPLVAEEIDEFFWGKLVNLGWRRDDTPLIKDTKAKVTRFIYVCPDCDLPLHAQNAINILPSIAKKMCNLELLNEKLIAHKNMVKECRPVDDEEESKAIPEAIPVFEKPSTGRLRIDTIDGETKAFNGERWVSIS